MKKPVIFFPRPVQWATMPPGEKFRFRHLCLCGPAPVLRDGTDAWDSVGALLEDDLLDWAVDAFRAERPALFLFGPMYARDGTKLQVAGVRLLLERLKDASPGTLFAYWNGNQQGKVDFNLEAFLPFVDVVFTNTDDLGEHQVFRAAGVKRVETFYQFGFDPEEHGRHRDPVHDLHFAGSQTFSGRPAKYQNSEWRYRLVCRMASEFDLVVYGKGSWPFPKRGHVAGQRFYDTFTEARAVLGANHWDLVRYYTRRTVYALASGRPYVVRYVPGMERDFECWEDLVWFKEIDEGVEAVRRLLADPAKAKAIGERGRRLAVERFSWAAMRRRLERLAEKLL